MSSCRPARSARTGPLRAAAQAIAWLTRAAHRWPGVRVDLGRSRRPGRSVRLAGVSHGQVSLRQDGATPREARAARRASGHPAGKPRERPHGKPGDPHVQCAGPSVQTLSVQTQAGPGPGQAGAGLIISPFILDAKIPITAAMYWSNVGPAPSS